jgi:hypothetical protein
LTFGQRMPDLDDIYLRLAQSGQDIGTISREVVLQHLNTWHSGMAPGIPWVASRSEITNFNGHWLAHEAVCNDFHDRARYSDFRPRQIALSGPFFDQSTGMRHHHDIQAVLVYLGYKVVEEVHRGSCDLLIISGPFESERHT